MSLQELKFHLQQITQDSEAVELIETTRAALRARLRQGRHYDDTPLCNALDDALLELVKRFGLDGDPSRWAAITSKTNVRGRNALSGQTSQVHFAFAHSGAGIWPLDSESEK